MPLNDMKNTSGWNYMMADMQRVAVGSLTDRQGAFYFVTHPPPPLPSARVTAFCTGRPSRAASCQDRRLGQGSPVACFWST